jgi:hypothetical protein
MGLRNRTDKKSPLDDSKGLFVQQKSTESVPLSQVEYGLSLILTLLPCFEWFHSPIVMILVDFSSNASYHRGV